MTHHTTPAQAEGLYDPTSSTTAAASPGRPPRRQADPRVVAGARRRSTTSSTAAPTGADVRHRRRRRDHGPAPARVLPARSPTSSCPARPVRGRHVLPPQRPGAAAQLQDLIERRARRGPAGRSAGATSRSTRTSSAGPPPRRAPRQPALHRGRPRRADEDAFERNLFVDPPRAELEAGPDSLLPSLSSRTLVYKGMLTAPQLPRLLPRPPDGAAQHLRDRPLALLDEHVAELGARPAAA